jgi:hypothetical protein
VNTAANTPTGESETAAGAGAPALTPIELDAALLLTSDGAEASIQRLAAQLDLDRTALLDILSRPHVAAWIEAALAVQQLRADILARRAHAAALQTLAEVAQDRERDPVERRRAATAILRTTHPHRQRAAKAPEEPGESQPSALAALKQLRAEAALGTHTLRGGSNEDGSPNPDPSRIFNTIAEALATADPQQPETFTPIHTLCARNLRTLPLADFLARTSLHLAASAQLIGRSDPFDHGPWRCRQFAFQTTAGPVSFQFSLLNFGVATPRWSLAAIDIGADHPDDPEDDASLDGDRDLDDDDDLDDIDDDDFDDRDLDEVGADNSENANPAIARKAVSELTEALKTLRAEHPP